MTIYIPIGISGSGKSSYQKKFLPKVNVICPDTIRKQLTGDVSNQSMNTEVWIVAYDQLESYVIKGEDVYFSSTNLSTKAIDLVINKVENVRAKNLKVKYEILLLTDSEDEELCRSRVRADLENKIDRSNTLVQADDGEGNLLDYDVIHKQHEDYLKMKNEVKGVMSAYFESGLDFEYEIKEV